MASGLTPLDGVLVPTFGAFYVAVTLLFPLWPFVPSAAKKKRARFVFWCNCRIAFRR